MIRWAVRIALGLIGLFAAAATTYWAVNATDEELTAEARELLQPPALEATGADNAWQAGVAFRELPESKPQEAWLRWHALREAPLSQARAIQPTLQWLLITRAPLHSQYRRVRTLPRYGETGWPSHPMAELPIDGALVDGAGLALAEIALAALDGRLEDAVAEVEREAVYHRRVLAGSRMLLGRVFAANAIIRDMVMVSDLLEMHGEKLRPYRARLMKVVAPLRREDLDLSSAYELEARMTAQALLQYRDVILNDNKAYNEGREASGRPRLSTWEAYGYRSQATVNEFARRHEAYRQFVKTSYKQAWEGGGIPERQDRTPSQRWRLVNPTGNLLGDEGGWWGTMYSQRLKDLSALVALVGLQVALTLDERKRDAFLREARRDRAVVLDEPFKSRATFDPESSTIRYKPRETRGAIGEVAKRFGGEFVVPAGPRREAR